MADQPTKKPESAINAWSKAGLWAIGLIMAMIMLQYMNEPSTPEEKAAAAAKAQQEKLEKARNNVMRDTYLAVRENLRDPDSMQVEVMLASAKPEAACIAYRARNGFGGMTRDVMVWDGNKYAKTATAWKKTCSGPHMEDITYLSSSMDSSYQRRNR